MRGLDGKNVIVTGGGGAIGAAICRRFAGYGARVGVFDKNVEGARKLAAEIKGFASGGDITDYDAVGKEIARFEKECGPTDVLVNNAGWDKFVNFVDTTPDLWEQVIAINLRGPLNMSHFVLKGMVARKRGAIVNVGSTAGLVGDYMLPVYSAMKGAVHSFTKVLANEVATHNILVNAICVGRIDSEQWRRFHSQSGSALSYEDYLAEQGRAIPLGRMGRPDEFASLLSLLASEAGGYITGTAINVDGGLSPAV